MARTEPTPQPGRLPDADVTSYAGHTIKMVEGRRLTIDVEATGTPTPTIRWRLPSGDRIGRGQSVGRASVLANDSLVITDTQPSDSGSYRPIASNAAGLAKVKGKVTVVGKLLFILLMLTNRQGFSRLLYFSNKRRISSVARILKKNVGLLWRHS